jgi:hypothetical protein
MDNDKIQSSTERVNLISISELFESSISFYKRHWKVLASIQLPPAILALLSFFFFTPELSKTVWIVVTFSILNGLLTAFSWLASMWLVLRDEKATMKEAYQKSLPYLIPAFVIGLLATLAVLCGIVLLIIPGIYLSIAFSLGHYVLFSEGLKGTSALKASKYYIKGYWWAVFGRYILLGLVIGLLQVVFALISGIFDPRSYLHNTVESSNALEIKTPSIADYVSTMLSLFVLTPISIVYTYGIYESLKRIKGKYTPSVPRS